MVTHKMYILDKKFKNRTYENYIIMYISNFLFQQVKNYVIW
jgi:hypothetical protein